MWRSIKKYYKLIILSIAVGAIVIYLINWYSESRELNKLFDPIEKIDYSSVESVVITKLSQVLDETKENSDSPEQWGKLGMNLYIHEYKTESVPVFKKASSLDKNDFRWVYFCALALEYLNSEETNDWFERGRLLKPNYPPLYIKLGSRYLIAGELDKATELFTEVLTSWKNLPHAYLGLAKIAIASNELDTAQVYLDKALAMAPSYRDAHVLLADVYRRKGEKASVEAEFQKIKRLPPKLDLTDPIYNQMMDEGVSSFWHQVRGDNYFNSGQLDKAVLELKKVVEMKPSLDAYSNLGNVYQKQKKYQLAINQYNLAHKIDSLNEKVLNNLGVIYFKTGDINKAISFARHSLEINPELKDGYLNLGTFYKQQNRRSESIKYFKQGMILDPDDLRFAFQLSWLLSSAPEKYLRDGKEALRLAEFICDQTNYDTPSTLDLLAAALAENGQYTEACDIAMKAYQLALRDRNRQLSTAINKRLGLYKMNKPFREVTD